MLTYFNMCQPLNKYLPMPRPLTCNLQVTLHRCLHWGQSFTVTGARKTCLSRVVLVLVQSGMNFVWGCITIDGKIVYILIPAIKKEQVKLEGFLEQVQYLSPCLDTPNINYEHFFFHYCYIIQGFCVMFYDPIIFYCARGPHKRNMNMLRWS